MFDGKLENSELKGCTKLEKIEYIKEIPAPGILIFGTLYVLFLCMGWIKVTDFVLFMISFVIIIMIDRRSTLRRGTKKIKKYIQKFNRELKLPGHYEVICKISQNAQPTTDDIKSH